MHNHALACFPTHNPDGTEIYTSKYNTYTLMDGYHMAVNNPNFNNTEKITTVSNTVELTIHPIKQLELKGNYTYTFYHLAATNRSVNASYSETPDKILTLSTGIFENKLSEKANTHNSHSVNLYGTYSDTFAEAHNLKVMAGFNYETKHLKDIGARGWYLISETLDDLSLTGIDENGDRRTEVSGGQNEYAVAGFFGRVNYDYKHRYSFAATFRADGSSKFSKANRWGFFPSAAASWTISNEPWMQGAGWVDQLKLRYSFGSAGNNNIPAGQINKEYSATATTWLSQSSSYWMAGKVMNNPDLKWETTYTHNFGLDFSFFKSRLSGSIEAYQNVTRDLLINFPITGSGYDSQYRNIGSTRNRGVELTLNAPVVSKKDFSLNISGNIAYNKNMVTDLGGLETIFAQSYWASTEIGDDYVVKVGEPLGNMYGYRCDGRYEVSDFTYSNGKWTLNEGVVNDGDIIGSSYLRPGALKLKDLNGDGKVTVADREVIGNASPDITGGFSINGYLYGFDFNANFNYMIGNEVYNANKVEFTSSRKFYNRNLVEAMDVDKRWTSVDWSTGELIEDPAALEQLNRGTTMWSPFVGQAVFSDWAVEDASFLRLQSATIGYTLPGKVTEKVHLRKVRFYLTGTNLFCLTKYSGYDPEVDTRRATPLTPGVDYSAYPKSIGYVFGVNVTF